MKSQDASVVTLYVSGRRPGEFSTVLSTVQSIYDHSATLQKRQADLYIQTTIASNNFKNNQEVTELKYLMNTVPSSLKGGTTSLESIVGDVSVWLDKSSKKTKLILMETELATIKNPGTYIINI